uniref:Uncharacterized protein n=1 Tax=Glycine max TaxID=3847 RepID=A0A0R0GQE5_SOYBN
MCKVRGCYFWCFICLKMMWKILKIKVITEYVFDYSHRIRKYMFPYCAFVCQVRSPVNVMDLDDIMSELESSDNFCSFVNGDGDNDVTEVYPNDDDDQHDVRLEDEDEVDSEVHNDDGGDYDDFWIPGLLKEECISIDSMIDIRQFDMEEITDEVVRRLDFGDLELAYQFYCWYAKSNGFSIRKSHIVRNTCMKTLQQTFVCSCAGYRRVSTSDRRMQREKKESRCGCEAMFCVHNFDHNHLLLDLKLSCLLLGHRKMFAFDIMQVENYRKVGIRPPHMHATFANQCGGYDKVWFIRKDIYNEEGRMRKQHTSDGSGALKYLHDLRKKDPMMYVSYTADEGSGLQQLFWDVLAFDATYKENKYLCPFVVFTSVSNHNQTIVFAAAVVTDETEETYVWLLEQLLVAMKGKTPSSIITDGYLAMRNAITRIMLGVFHRLCAWHLLRNALSHVRDKQVLKWLKKLMLGDFEVVEFEEKWKEMVATFELEDNTWIAELYEKRMKWSPAHLRGYFFAGIQTTSRCEAFHAHVAKYVHSRTNLTDFSYLCRTIKLRVVDCKEMVAFSIYTVVKYCSGSVWLVSYCPSTVDFSRSCMRMKSIGLPCDHILVVLVSLNFMELPSSLVLSKWSKVATENIKDKYLDSAMYWDSQLMARYATLVEVSRQVCEAAYCDEEEYDKMLHFLSNEARRLKSKKNRQPCVDDNND